MTRRELLRATLAGCLLSGCASRPAPRARAPGPPPGGPKLRVVCVGAHPDDPESGCGGTLARYADSGHDVHVVYVTRGELGIVGKSPEEAGSIRAAEAVKACRALGATPHFFGHPSGKLIFSPEAAAELVGLFDRLAVDVVFGHWPIDTDYDHQVASMLTLRAYLAKRRAHPLYFYEVENGTQSLGFSPGVYVEIGDVLKRKLAAIRAHESQYAEERIYERHHEPMERFRAREVGGTAVEAFAVFAPEAPLMSVAGLR